MTENLKSSVELVAGNNLPKYDALSYIKRVLRDETVKLDKWNGPIFALGVSFQNGRFANLIYFVNFLLANKNPNCGPPAWPEYVFTCNEKFKIEVEIEDIIDIINEKSYIEIDAKDIKWKEELATDLEIFNEHNKDFVSYQTDFTEAVRVPAYADATKWLKEQKLN